MKVFAPHVVELVGWLVGWVLLLRLPRLGRGDGSGPAARDGVPPGEPSTIIVPARNEARSLGGLLSDLARLRPAGSRVIVVDDHSEDGTGDLARSFPFVEVMEPLPPPPGWTGKTNACWTAVASVPAGTLVFLDADVRLSGRALDDVLAVHRRKGGLVSVWPWHVVESLYEQASALFGVVAVMAAGPGSLVPPRRRVGAFGPVLVTLREDYFAAGGHEAVRGELTEDFALAGVYRRQGRPVTVLGGRPGVTFRMYPEGFCSLVEGWTRNLGGGVGSTSLLRAGGIALWQTAAVGPLAWAGGLSSPASRVLYALFALQMAWYFRQLGRFAVTNAVVYPLHVAFFALVFARALLRRYVLHRVVWRGRTVVLAAPLAASEAGPLPGRAAR